MSTRLTEQDQRQRREWFRVHWAQDIAFNRHCGIQVVRWDGEGAELFLPYADWLSAHAGIFHGGVVSALLDTTATGAVMAGHDFAKGSRLTTVSLSVQYLSVAPGENLVAHRQVHAPRPHRSLRGGPGVRCRLRQARSDRPGRREHLW